MDTHAEPAYDRYMAQPTEEGAIELGTLVVDMASFSRLDPLPPDGMLPDHLIAYLFGYYREKARRAEAYLAERKRQRGPIQ